MTFHVRNLKPNLRFDVFTVEKTPQLADGSPNPNFGGDLGFAWYQPDLETNRKGEGNIRLGVTPFNGEHQAGPLVMITRLDAETKLGPLCTSPKSLRPGASRPGESVAPTRPTRAPAEPTARLSAVTSPPLVPPETKAMVGEALGAPVSATITRRESQRYARAVGDLDPIYFDEAAAAAAGYLGLVAPPTFVGHAVVEGSTLDDLREDGLWVDRGRKLRLGVSRSMFGGEEWEFRVPVLVGDTITAQRRLGAVEEKDGRSGPFVLLHYETTFTNQRDEIVAVSRLVGIAR